MTTSTELRKKLAAKQDELGKVFAEAKTDDGQVDFNKVTCLGDAVKGSVAVAEKVRQMDAELNDIAEEAETVEAAENAAKAHAAREKAVNRPPHAQPGTPAEPSVAQRLKSIAELAAADSAFKQWQAKGAAGGVKLSLPELLPSDVFAKSSISQTMATKALFETTAGWAPESLRIAGIVEAVTRPVQILDIVPLAQTGSELIKYMEETTRTHAAAEKAEGATFAESTFELTEKSSPVEKITDSVPVTDEQLEDVAQVESYLDQRLTFGLRQRLDSQILVGNGTTPNLRGIKNVVGIQTQAKGVDDVPDAFFKAMTKVRLVGRAIPTHHLIHPTDWQGVRLLRTADGIYIWGNPSEPGVDRMWGLPVVQQDADAAGTGYVGSFQAPWISLYERRGVDIQVGFVGTQFLEGKRTIRGDMRMALAVFRPAAFATVTGL